jgi:integrase/recombinase XerD
MENRFDEFVNSRRYLKNVTPKTIAWYHDSFAALTRSHPDTPPTRESLRALVVNLRQGGLSAISCNTYCRAINAYLRWLHQEGYATEVLRIPPLKTESKVLPTFTPAQVKAMITFKPRSFGQQRIWTMVCLLLDTGLRIEEALSLSKDRVDLDNSIVRVFGKGQKQRVVPISFELRRVLFRWMQKHEFTLIFPTREGAHQTQRNVLRDFKALGKRLGITGVRISFHTLRHTFALNYIRNGGDVFRLQRILGHSTLEMTRRYVNLQTEDLSAVHNRLSTFANSV